MAPGMAPVPPPPALHGAYDAPACAPPPTFMAGSQVTSWMIKASR